MAKKTEKKTDKPMTKMAPPPQEASSKPAFQPLENSVYKDAIEVDGGVIARRGNTLSFHRNKTIQDGKIK